VDDIILTCSSISVVDDLIRSLSLTFPIKDLGSLNFFLGVEVLQSSTSLHLSQKHYIADILKRTNMKLAKPITSPMSVVAPLNKLDGISMADPTIYRNNVKALQYLSITRPDIAFVVNKVSQFANDPCDFHWSAIKRILRCLKHTIMYGLLIKPCLSSQLVVFSYVNWVGYPDDRKSTSDYCTFFGGNLLSRSSRKQPTVSRSSTESEYKSFVNATAELLWTQSLLREPGIFLLAAPILYCDNVW
jgi:hypothetical protein